jgi:hypothetical protein
MKLGNQPDPEEQEEQPTFTLPKFKVTGTAINTPPPAAAETEDDKE